MGNVLWENLEFIRIAENRMEYGPDLAHGMENSTYNSTEKVQYFFKTNTFLFFFILIALVWALFDANENATMWTVFQYYHSTCSNYFVQTIRKLNIIM